ncbi:unnamed protein product [Arabidopsis halleri]
MKMRFGGEKKITVEEYVDFFTSGNSRNFTISYLNQILHMHGFRKLHKLQKKIVGEAVDTLDLLDLSRSTLKEATVSSPSSSPLTLDEVISDIEALKWQECCLTSLQIINSQEITGSVPKPKQKKSNKRKKATMKKSLNAANFGDENDNTMMMMIPAIPRKMRNKKAKKNLKSITTLVNDAASATKPLSDYNFSSRFTSIP